jgi:hypothetical protein
MSVKIRLLNINRQNFIEGLKSYIDRLFFCYGLVEFHRNIEFIKPHNDRE